MWASTHLYYTRMHSDVRPQLAPIECSVPATGHVATTATWLPFLGCALNQSGSRPPQRLDRQGRTRGYSYERDWFWVTCYCRVRGSRTPHLMRPFLVYRPSTVSSFPATKMAATSSRWCPNPLIGHRPAYKRSLHQSHALMVARMLFLFAMMGSGRAVVSTIGQVRQVSFEAYDQNTGAALDADSRDVTVTNDGDCCMPEAGLEPLTRTGLLFTRSCASLSRVLVLGTVVYTSENNHGNANLSIVNPAVPHPFSSPSHHKDLTHSDIPPVSPICRPMPPLRPFDSERLAHLEDLRRLRGADHAHAGLKPCATD